ncbi:LAYN protein, partial [Atractosteus spatula]|nr:LAYN protein [Atractosteus spatula]
MPACLPCGAWAQQPRQGQDTCVCPGQGQTFQASDGQCPCALGYRPAGEGSGLCVPRVYEICREGTARTQEGACLDRDQWARHCARQVCPSPADYQGYDKRLGLCLCRAPDVSAVCDRPCRRRQRQALQLACRGALKLLVASSGTQVKVSVRALEGVLGSWDSLLGLRCAGHLNDTRPVYLVETNEAGFLGVLNPDPSDLQGLLWRSRRESGSPDGMGSADTPAGKQSRNLSFAGILNPSVCLSLGDVLLFALQKEHFPQYDIDNLYNTNADFDWGAFRALAEDMTLSPAPPGLFSLVLPEPGVYVLRLSSNQHKRMYVKVMPIGGQCYEAGPFFPTIPRHMVRMGMARSRPLLLRPDWLAVAGLLAGAVLLLGVCVALLILFREYGWPEKTPTSPRYRRLQLKYSLDDCSSKGSTSMAAVQKLHRSLQAGVSGPGAGGAAQAVPTLTTDEFWDYERQIDLEAFDTDVFYDILMKHTVSVTTRLGQLKDEVKELYGKVVGRVEILGALWVSRLTAAGRGAGVKDAAMGLYQRKRQEVEGERARRRGLAAQAVHLLDRQLRTLRQELGARQEQQGAFRGQLGEALRLLEQLCGRVMAQRVTSLVAQMAEGVAQECQRRGAWAVLGKGTGALLWAAGRGEALRREELIAPDGTVRASDAVRLDPCTGLIVPSPGAQMLLASGHRVPVPPDFFVHPQTGRVLPVAGNVGYCPVRSRLVFMVDSCSDRAGAARGRERGLLSGPGSIRALIQPSRQLIRSPWALLSPGEADKWETPLLPFVPYPVSRRTGLPVKCRLQGLQPGQEMAFGGPMCDPDTGLLVPILAVTIHPESGLVYPLGGTHTCPLTLLPQPIQIGGAMLDRQTGSLLLIVGVSLDPKSGGVIPVGGLPSPAGGPLLLGDSFAEPLSGRPGQVWGASLRGGKPVAHSGGHQALLDSHALACGLRVTELLKEAGEAPGERGLVVSAVGELERAWGRSDHCLLQLLCGLEGQLARARDFGADGGSQGVMKFPGTELTLPALAGLEYPDPGGSGLLIPVLGAQWDWDRGVLIPLAGTMEDADGKGLVPIRIGARTVDPTTGRVGPVVGARFDPVRSTVVPITQAYSQLLRGHPDPELVHALQREARLRREFWRARRQEEEELLRGVASALRRCCGAAARGRVEKAQWRDSAGALQGAAQELQEAALAEAHRRALEKSELSGVLPSDVLLILTEGDEGEWEQEQRVQAVLGSLLDRVSVTVDRLRQEQDRMTAGKELPRQLEHSRAWALGVREQWERLLARQASLEAAVGKVHCHREYCQLRAATAEAVLSGSFWVIWPVYLSRRTRRSPGPSARPLWQKCNEILCVCSPSSGDGGRPFLDLVDAQWRCEGELVPLGPDGLSPREFLVYQHGLYLLGLLRAHIQVPEITVQLAASLPTNDYTYNAFRHSFFYQEAEKTLFVRRQRLQGVGGFSLLLLHCLAHIASGQLSPDSSPVFLRVFFQTLQVCLGELFLLRLVAPQGCEEFLHEAYLQQKAEEKQRYLEKTPAAPAGHPQDQLPTSDSGPSCCAPGASPSLPVFSGRDEKLETDVRGLACGGQQAGLWMQESRRAHGNCAHLQLTGAGSDSLGSSLRAWGGGVELRVGVEGGGFRSQVRHFARSAATEYARLWAANGHTLNWHWDEPSCGYEVCVVMYHQPSAPPGPGGLYMFQWNDDNCDTKNNFICKYTQEKGPVSTPTANSTHTEAPATSPRPKYPPVTDREEKVDVLMTKSKDNILNIVYIVIPTIPLLLLLLVATGVFCFRLFASRRKERTEACHKEPTLWMSPDRGSSPSLDVYHVIRKQHEADLAGTRPDIKITSFRGSSPAGGAPDDQLSSDYDNMGGNNSESGFATLASTESGFVTNDIYETCQGRGRPNRESGWVENEIYGY